MRDGKLCIALVGIGWAGTMHAKAYYHVYGQEIVRKTVCALEPTVGEFAKKHHFEQYTKNFEDVLQDSEIDVVDLVTPPNLHKTMAIAAMQAGKHVICEKPLLGYFGAPDDPAEVGNVSREKMFNMVRKDLEELEAVIRKTGKTFCFAANWIYSPAFQRTCELICAKGTTVVEIQGLVGHKGSPASYVKYWSKSGGGTLGRNIVHPLGAAVYLKKLEMENKGLNFGIRSVMCDCSQVTKQIENRYIEADPVDTEDWAHAIFTFNDGTKAVVTAADTYLGECTNTLAVYGNDAVFRCNFSPSNLLEAYFSDDRNIQNEEISEKSDHNMGHMRVGICEEEVRGYYEEIQDFIECIREGRTPRADFGLAKYLTLLVQAAYCAAEWGRTVKMTELLP
mgnify:CR=1 FL=1